MYSCRLSSVSHEVSSLSMFFKILIPFRTILYASLTEFANKNSNVKPFMSVEFLLYRFGTVCTRDTVLGCTELEQCSIFVYRDVYGYIDLEQEDVKWCTVDLYENRSGLQRSSDDN